MVRIRTIKQAVKEIKEKDPDTALSEYALRRLIKSGKMPSISCGGKYLVNMDMVEKILNS